MDGVRKWFLMMFGQNETTGCMVKTYILSLGNFALSSPARNTQTSPVNCLPGFGVEPNPKSSLPIVCQMRVCLLTQCKELGFG